MPACSMIRFTDAFSYPRSANSSPATRMRRSRVSWGRFSKRLYTMVLGRNDLVTALLDYIVRPRSKLDSQCDQVKQCAVGTGREMTLIPTWERGML